MDLHVILHILEHALLDSIKALPFLFLAYLLMEAAEHYHSAKMEQAIRGIGKAGPLVGAALGCIPQCGFSASASNLFATNHQQTAESSNFITTDPDYSIVEVNMAETDMLEGLRDGLVGGRAGEECEILFTAKYGYGNKTFGIIPVNSALLYKIWVVGVSND